MNVGWVLRYYRTWLVLLAMIVMSSLVILTSMLNQLGAEGNAFSEGRLGMRQNPHDTHMRSIRNYEQRPREKFKILQVLQPVVEFVKDDSSRQESSHPDEDRNSIPQFDLKFKNYAQRAQISGERHDVNNDAVNPDDDDDDDLEEDFDDADNENDDIGESDKNSDNENQEFKPGDFPGIVDFQKPPFKYEEIHLPTQPNGGISAQKQVKPLFLKKLQAKTIKAKAKKIHNQKDINLGSYTDGIYWTFEAENTVPLGKSPSQISSLLSYIRKQHVKSLHPPEWNRCGRPLNGMVNLQDGSTMCARYRTPHNKLILGEVMSFHLSRMLGMDNVPPVVLSWVSDSSPQWTAINYTALQWEENQTVALIDWIPDINLQGSQVVIPRLIHEAYQNKSSITPQVLAHQHLRPDELSQLVQWGDMIIFDYLTGNYDRFASMQDAADKEDKTSILLEHVRNLKKSTKSGKLWLIDNESGLFDAYDLLYLERKQRFLEFHRQMLQTMCVFHRNFVDKVEDLMNTQRPDMALLDYARSQDILLDSIPQDSMDKSYSLFHSKFMERLGEVLQWVEMCKTRYAHK